MMPMARAMVSAVVLVIIGVDLLRYDSYLWRVAKLPWRVVARWRVRRDMTAFGRVRPRNEEITLSVLHTRELQKLDDAREQKRLRLIVGASSRGL